MGVPKISSIEDLYRESGNRLWWALFAYTGSREIASDSGSEAFAAALASRSQIRDPAAWIWRVAFRIATDELREARRTVDQPTGAYEIDDSAMHVVLSLGQLSKIQRAVVILFYLEDRPTKEIAEILGIATSTVYVHLYRVRQRLRSILGEDHA